MREILFRGKSAEDGKWFTGQLLHFKSPVSEKELNVVVEGCEWDDSNEWFNIGRRAKVVPETVGLFTGLIDKNGKKIFEGDIITMQKYGKGKHKSLVYFKNGKFAVDGSNYTFKDICPRNMEIIGNIHDNPELLKGCEG